MSRLPIRLLLPIILGLVVLLLLASSVQRNLISAERNVVQSAREDLLSASARLVRLAADGRGGPAALESELTHLATDPRVTFGAVVGPDGRIIFATRFALKGRAVDSLPDYAPAQHDIARSQLAPLLHTAADGLHLSVLQSYSENQNNAALRGLDRGVVRLDFDLTRIRSETRAQLVANALPDLLATLVLAIGLGWVMHRALARPLGALARASRSLESGDTTVRVRPEGPAEVAHLAQAFNHMAARLGESLTTLCEREETLATTLRSIGDALISTDLDGRVVLMNPVAEALTGWTQSEARGRPVAEVFKSHNAHTGTLTEIPVARVLADGRIVGLANHTVLAARDGAHYHIADSAAPIRGADGALAGVVMVFRDVSDEYALRESLREREQMYRTLADSGQALIWTADPDLRCEFVNAQWLSFTGTAVGQALGDGWLEAVHPDDRTACRQARLRACAQREPYETAYRLRHHDGDWRRMSEYGSPRFDSKGHFLGYIGHCLDVTESTRTRERELAQARLLQRVVGGEPLDALLAALARYIEQQGEGLKCALMLASQRGGTLRTAAAPSLPAEYNALVNELPIGEGQGSCGTAAARRTQVIIPDVHRSPLWAPFLPAMAPFEWLRACWSTPFFDSQGQLLGTFGVYCAETRAPSPQERALIDFAASVAGMVVERHRSQESLQLAALAFETTEALAVSSGERFVRANQAFCTLVGYTTEEIRGLRGEALCPPDEHHRVEAIRAHFHDHDHWEGDIPVQCKDGHIFPGWLSIRGVRSEQGQLRWTVTSLFDLTERKRTEAEIFRLAHVDVLTDLPNRRLFDDRLKQALAASRRSGHLGAVLFIDLDHFKRINDARGHATGDRLLSVIAQRLRESVREEDTVARLGGDEFVVVLTELASEDEHAARRAMSVAHKLQRAVHDPIALDGIDYRIGVSIGVTIYHPDRRSADEILREADTAMYRAKESGRNAICYFEAAMQEEVEARFNLEHDLHGAIARDELRLFIQPKVDVSGRVVGGETLLRWEHPVHGLMSPGAFIPIAEDSGQILALGVWVLEQACRLLADPRLRDRRLSLAVNVSPRQFRQPDFVDRVLRIVADTGAAPTQLTLEVTEGLLIEHVADTVEKMRRLAELGIRFSIDDFGTGYSSLAYLKRLPIREIKIDRTFVQDAPADPNDAAIVDTILAMADHLGLEVVAEGVETEAHLAFLSARRHMLYQGYLFGRPEAAEGWLARLDAPDRDTIIPLS